MKLTREQGAIISAYTGFLAGPFEDLHVYAEKLLRRPIFTHEFANTKISEKLHELSKDDFIALVPNAKD